MPTVELQLTHGAERGTMTYGGRTVAIGVSSTFKYPSDTTINVGGAGVKKKEHLSGE